MNAPESRASQPTARRLRHVALAALLWAGILFVRLFQLQVVEHEPYVRYAQSQQERTVEIRAPRGTISDRNGEPLAMSLPITSVCVSPIRIKDPSVAADLLAGVLGLDRTETLARLLDAVRARRGFLWVKRRLTPRQEAALRSYQLDWVEFRTESQRYYPKGQLASHVVGSVDHEQRGNAGLEQSLDRELRGQAGSERLLTDVRRRGVASQVFADMVAGKHVTLTLDERIQHVAERELAAAAQLNGAKTGSVVVMNPHNGEILAMANWPTFDPNLDPDRPVKAADLALRDNLAISTPYEPGSIFKTVTMSAALETTRLRPESLIQCPSVLRLPGRVVHEAHTRAATIMPMADVYARSSNVGSINIALEVGHEILWDYVKKFGFGRTTGLPLPAESPGLFGPPQARNPNNSLASVAIGHEISTTAIQLAQAASVVANGGRLVRPVLILSKARPGEAAEVPARPEPRPVLKPQTVVMMRKMMEGVVTLPYGTGKATQLAGYSSGGKTGTAQIFDLANRTYTSRYNGSFMGFAPMSNPAVVVVVTLNGVSKYGGVVAGPVFKHVAAAALRMLDVPKDLPDQEPAIQLTSNETDEAASDLARIERTDGEPGLPLLNAALVSASMPPVQGPINKDELVVDIDGPRVPDFQGKTVRAVLHQATSLGLPVEFVGTGLARAQAPLPGEVLAPGTKIRIRFGR